MPCSISAAAVRVSTPSGTRTSLRAGQRRIRRRIPRVIAQATRSPGCQSMTRSPTALDNAGALHARREGQRHFVETGPVIDVDEVDAGCFDLYEDVFLAGLRSRRFVNAELFGTAGLVNAYGFHRLTLPSVRERRRRL